MEEVLCINVILSNVKTLLHTSLKSNVVILRRLEIWLVLSITTSKYPPKLLVRSQSSPTGATYLPLIPYVSCYFICCPLHSHPVTLNLSLNLPRLLTLTINWFTSIGTFSGGEAAGPRLDQEGKDVFASSAVMRRSCRCKHPSQASFSSKRPGERPQEMAASQRTSWSHHTQVKGVISPGYLAQAFHQPRLAHCGIPLIREV